MIFWTYVFPVIKNSSKENHIVPICVQQETITKLQLLPELSEKDKIGIKFNLKPNEALLTQKRYNTKKSVNILNSSVVVEIILNFLE